MPIRYKDLGQTGVKVPEIGIGTWQYRGGPALLRKAVEFGAALIDTAESYGNEEIVGQAIKGIRDRVFVATKTNHWRYSDVIQSAEASLQKLGIERIDLYQIHWPNVTVPIAETLEAMEELVEAGKVRFVGISNFAVSEMKRAQRVMRKNRIVANQVCYGLIERTIERRLLPYCASNEVTVIAYSPLASGFRRLIEADPSDVLGHVARMANRTRAQVALNWCVSRGNVVALTRTESLPHLIENCGSSGWSLTEDQARLLEREIRFHRRGAAEATLRRLARAARQWKEALTSSRTPRADLHSESHARP